MLLSPAAASFDMFEDYEARGRAFKAAVGAPRRGGRLMDFVSRLPFGSRAVQGSGSRRGAAAAASRRSDRGRGAVPVTAAARDRRSAVAAPRRPRPSRARTSSAASATSRTTRSSLAVVALAAIGILMVYSSSAMQAYIQRDDTLAIVGPQIFWAALGILAMVVMMRIDYRWLRLVSVPGYAIALVLLVLVFVPGARTASSAAPRAGSSSGRCRPSTRPRSPSSR